MTYQIQTNRSQFADDTGQWAMSKSIHLAVKYLQKDFYNLARWCAKWRIKLNPEKTKVIIFPRSTNAIRAELALSLYGDLLSYYPHIKFLGITFESRMTFVKHFQDILDHCTHSFYRLRYWSTKNGTKSHNHFTDLQTVCKTNIQMWDCFHNNGFGIRLSHETSGLPYVKARLISVDQNQSAKMHVNPLTEHTINSARTNIAWDKYHTPLTILKLQD